MLIPQLLLVLSAAVVFSGQDRPPTMIFPSTVPPQPNTLPLLAPPRLDSPMTKRIIDSLPDIPTIISSQIRGNPDDLRRMVSNILGDGLMGKIVTDPLLAAEELGVGLNRSEVINSFQSELDRNPNNISSLIRPLFGISTTTTTPAPTTTTTENTMFIDGIPMADFDTFIRRFTPKTSKGEQMTTRKPTTTTASSPEAVAAAVLQALEKSKHQRYESERMYNDLSEMPVPISSDSPYPHPQRSRYVVDTLSENQIEPRYNERLLRRAPTRSSTRPPMYMPTTRMPQEPIPHGFSDEDDTYDPLNTPISQFDPQIERMVNTLKSKSINSISVGEVRELQAVLQNFEQTLQTKELFQKKKALKDVQEKLNAQKAAIEEQRKREMELKEKERELEAERQKAEQQLMAQLNNFQSNFDLSSLDSLTPTSPPTLMPREFPSFDSSIIAPPVEPLSMKIRSMDVPSQAEQQNEVNGFSMSSFDPPLRKSFPMVEPNMFEIGAHNRPLDALASAFSSAASPPSPPQKGIFNGMSIIKRQPLPNSTPNPRSEQTQSREDPYSYTNVQPRKRITNEEESEANDSNEYDAPKSASQCECIPITMERMVGSWIPALAARKMINKIQRVVRDMFDDDEINLNCTKVDFSVPKHSLVAQDAKITWHFRTDRTRTTFKLRGNGLTTDHVLIRAQLADMEGDKLIVPFCVLKAEGRELYEYMIVTQATGPCNEGVLLVRNPDHFFDRKHPELVKYFKHMIKRKQLDVLEAVPYAHDCSSR